MKKPLQLTKVLPAIPPTAIKDDAAFVSNVIDTQGMSYIEFHGLLGASDIAMATLKVMASEVMTDATTLGGTPETVIDATTKPTADDDGKTVVFGVDLVAKPWPRYMQLQATAGNGSTGTFFAASAVAHFQGPIGSLATDRGAGYAQYA